MRVLACLLMVGLCVTGFACGVQHKDAQWAGSGLAALPAPSTLHPRMISDGGGRYSGYMYQETLPARGLAKEGSFLNFFPSESGDTLESCAYAMYYLPVDDPASGELKLSLAWWVEPQFGKLFLAVANRTRGAWEWRAITSADQIITLSPDDDYVDVAGGVVVALVVPPSAGTCALAYFDLQSTTGTGWKYAQVDSALGGTNNSQFQLEDVAIIAGKPAIVYQRAETDQPPQMRLALCSSADGQGAWEVLELGGLPDDSSIHISLAEIAGGYGIAYSVKTNSGSGELHYRFVAEPDPEFPDFGFTDNLAWQDLNGGFVWPKLLEVGGKPVIAVLGRNEGSYKPYFVVGDDDGLIWNPIKASDTVTPDSLTIEDSLPRPLLHGGLPLMSTLSGEDEEEGVFIHFANSAAPTQSSDWLSLRIGDAVDSRSLHSARVAGRPVFSANSLYSFPQVCTMFELTGTDGLQATEWTRTVLDNIGVSFSSQVQVFSLDGGLGIMAGDSYGVSEPELPFLNGAARAARLFSAGTIANNAQQWTSRVVEHDNSGTILDNMRCMDLAGQPAYAAVQYASTDDTDSGTETTLRWGVLRP